MLWWISTFIFDIYDEKYIWMTNDWGHTDIHRLLAHV